MEQSSPILRQLRTIKHLFSRLIKKCCHECDRIALPINTIKSFQKNHTYTIWETWNNEPPSSKWVHPVLTPPGSYRRFCYWYETAVINTTLTEKQVLKYLQSGLMRVRVSEIWGKRKLYCALYSPELYTTSEISKPKHYQWINVTHLWNLIRFKHGASHQYISPQMVFEDGKN